MLKFKVISVDNGMAVCENAVGQFNIGAGKQRKAWDYLKVTGQLKPGNATLPIGEVRESNVEAGRFFLYGFSEKAFAQEQTTARNAAAILNLDTTLRAVRQAMVLQVAEVEEA